MPKEFQDASGPGTGTALAAASLDALVQAQTYLITPPASALPATSGTLTVAQPAIDTVIVPASGPAQYVAGPAQNLTLQASATNYVDLTTAGAYVVTTSATPTANSIRLYSMVTTTVAGSAPTLMAPTQPLNATQVQNAVQLNPAAPQSGTISQQNGEVHVSNGVWVDPTPGVGAALKASGGIATDTLRASGLVTALAGIRALNGVRQVGGLYVTGTCAIDARWQGISAGNNSYSQWGAFLRSSTTTFFGALSAGASLGTLSNGATDGILPQITTSGNSTVMVFLWASVYMWVANDWLNVGLCFDQSNVQQLVQIANASGFTASSEYLTAATPNLTGGIVPIGTQMWLANVPGTLAAGTHTVMPMLQCGGGAGYNNTNAAGIAPTLDVRSQLYMLVVEL